MCTAPPQTSQMAWPSTMTRRPALSSGRACASAQLAAVMDDVAADHGEHRADLLQVFDGHAEVVVAQDHEVGQLAFLDAAELVLLAQEPPVLPRVEAQHLLPRDLLAGIDLQPARI